MCYYFGVLEYVVMIAQGATTKKMKTFDEAISIGWDQWCYLLYHCDPSATNRAD